MSTKVGVKVTLDQNFFLGPSSVEGNTQAPPMCTHTRAHTHTHTHTRTHTRTHTHKHTHTHTHTFVRPEHSLLCSHWTHRPGRVFLTVQWRHLVAVFMVHYVGSLTPTLQDLEQQINLAMGQISGFSGSLRYGIYAHYLPQC